MKKKSLRKGHFQLELNHDFGTDTIGAESAELYFGEGVATFRAKLKPISDDQASDADRSREKSFANVEYFSLMDAHIRKGIADFVKANKPTISGWRIEIEYNGNYGFSCEIQPMDPGGVMFHVIGA